LGVEKRQKMIHRGVDIAWLVPIILI